MATRAECEAALRIYRDALLAFRNVTDVGIVPLAGRAEATALDDLAVGIVVSVKVPLDALDPDDVLPSFLQLRVGHAIVKVPTRVSVTSA